MIKKILSKLKYEIKVFFRNFFYYSRFFKNKRKSHWNVRDFKNYDEYLRFQKEKTLDKSRRDKWLNEEWEEKTEYFLEIFGNLKKEINLSDKGNSLCIGARTGQEVHALRKLGYQSIGIDIVECKPFVILGDMHNLEYPDNTFDLIFCNIIDHSLYPEKSISEMERVLKPGGYSFIQITVGEATDKYGVTEIKSDNGILKLILKSKIIFSRSIKQYGIAQNWEILFKKNV